jgi:hypothetical protein
LLFPNLLPRPPKEAEGFLKTENRLQISSLSVDVFENGMSHKQSEGIIGLVVSRRRAKSYFATNRTNHVREIAEKHILQARHAQMGILDAHKEAE